VFEVEKSSPQVRHQFYCNFLPKKIITEVKAFCVIVSTFHTRRLFLQTQKEKTIMAEDKKDWTIMVYMAGDNNLSIDMAYALQQIKNVVKNNDKINLFVYYDGYSPSVPTLYCDFSGDDNRVYFRSHKIKKLYGKKAREDENSSAAYSVINFVDWCVNEVAYEKNGKTYKGRKAEKYALIFSGHSAAIHDIGLLRDETSNYHMTMPKVRWLLERITKTEETLRKEVEAVQQHRRNNRYSELSVEDIARRTKQILGQKLSILGFDSCIMSLLEVACQFKSVAKTMIASEGSIPNAGWTYAQILGCLAKSKEDASVADVAKSFVREFIRTQDLYTIGGVTADMAAWDLSLLDEVEKPFGKLVDNLLECFKEENSLIYNQMKRVLLQVHWSCQSYMFEQNIDLADFCWLLKNEVASLSKELGQSDNKTFENIIENCEEVIKQVRQCIILSGFSGGTYQYSNGVSVFFPWSVSGYLASRKNYEKLEFVSSSPNGKIWNQFLKKYLGEISLRKGKKPAAKAFAGLGGEVMNIDGSMLGDATDISYYSYVYKNNKLPVNGDQETSGNGNGRTPEDAEHRTPEDAEHRTPEDPEHRFSSENGGHKTPEDPEHRTPEDPEHRTPEDAEQRMFGTLSLFFSQLLRFKNTESEWNISGFTKAPEEVSAFGSDILNDLK
jgi:hypothetical protein